MKRVLVTGASGFVGSHLMHALHRRHYLVRAATRSGRRLALDARSANECVEIDDICETTDWMQAVESVDSIFHLAGRAHVMRKENASALNAFREVNAAGTARLAMQAAEAGVRRFVYVSSIKASTHTSTAPVAESDMPDPSDPYGRSKLEAEHLLLNLDSRDSMDIVIVRPPLVYGPGVGANFRCLMDIVRRRIPLPLAAVDNRRSMVFVRNLCDLLVACIESASVANQIFNVSDGEDLSTPDLLCKIAHAMGRRALLFPISPKILRMMLVSIGRSEDYSRLCDSLQVDISKADEVIGWRPGITVDEGIARTVEWYRRVGN